MTRVMLYVHDVALLKSFYRQHFALPVVDEIENEWVLFAAGNVELALHLVGPAYRDSTAPNRRHGNNVKLVFSIEAGLAEHRERLANAGVAVRDIKQYDGFACRMYDGIDPEGNVFQVMQRV
jgi:predicted enzyme related to lactoylglutathione lyase